MRRKKPGSRGAGPFFCGEAGEPLIPADDWLGLMAETVRA